MYICCFLFKVFEKCLLCMEEVPFHSLNEHLLECTQLRCVCVCLCACACVCHHPAHDYPYSLHHSLCSYTIIEITTHVQCMHIICEYKCCVLCNTRTANDWWSSYILHFIIFIAIIEVSHYRSKEEQCLLSDIDQALDPELPSASHLFGNNTTEHECDDVLTNDSSRLVGLYLLCF